MKKKTTTPARGKLRSMKVSASFKDFALDQLSGVPDLRARAMFGGIGLYAGEVFFGILAADTLYFKVDDSNRTEYETADASPFKPYADRAVTMTYYSVPLEILEHAPTLTAWAARAVAVARKKAASATKKRR